MRTTAFGLYLLATLPLAAGPIEDLQALERAMGAQLCIPLDNGWMPTDPNEDLDAWVGRNTRQVPDRPYLGAFPQRFRCAVTPPRRADGDRALPSWMAATQLVLNTLTPAHRQALADGRLVPLDSLTADAMNALLAVRGSLLMAGRERQVPPDSTVMRRDEEEFLHRTFTDAEWQQRVDRQRAAHRRGQLRAGLPLRLAIRMGLSASVTLTDADGKRIGAVHDALDAWMPIRQTSWRAGADGSFSPSDAPTVREIETRFEAELDAMPVGVEQVEFAESGPHSLAELVDLLRPLHPCSVHPDYALERLYLSAGTWPKAGLMADMARASGLLWRRDAGTGLLTLDAYPTLPAVERVELPDDLRDGLFARAEGNPWPFDLKQILPDGRTPARMAAAQLTTAQRQWLVEKAGTVRMFDGLVETVVPNLPADRFELPNVTVAFDTTINLTIVGLYNPGGGEDYLAELVQPTPIPLWSIMP